MFAFVFVLAFLLLLVTFRSVVIPLTAIILNLLWVAAVYGVLVLIFQDGRLQSLLDFQSVGGITAWLPLLFLGRLPAHRVGFFERELLDSDFIKCCARLVESQCLLTVSRRAEDGRDLDVSLCFGFAVAKGEMASFPSKLSHYPRPCLYLVSELNLIWQLEGPTLHELDNGCRPTRAQRLRQTAGRSSSPATKGWLGKGMRRTLSSGRNNVERKTTTELFAEMEAAPDVDTFSVTSNTPLFFLLVQIAQREGKGFAEGYGGDQPITPELVFACSGEQL